MVAVLLTMAFFRALSAIGCGGCRSRRDSARKASALQSRFEQKVASFAEEAAKVLEDDDGHLLSDLDASRQVDPVRRWRGGRCAGITAAVCSG